MRIIRKTFVTIIGLTLLLIGLILIVLPGPAILVIPLALALLATEYPSAKRWLRYFQIKLAATGRWLDRFFRRKKRGF